MDPDHHSKKLTIFIKRALTIPLTIVLGSVLSLAGCSLPRIIVLDDPLTPEEHLNLGVAYEKNKDFDSAIKHYNLALKKLPRAHLYLGNAYFIKEEPDMAETHYKKAIENNLQNADAYNNLAWLYYMKGKKLEEAERLVLKAIETDPLKKDIYEDTLFSIQRLKKSSE